MRIDNIAALVLLLVFIAVPVAADGNFDRFKALHGKKYANDAEEAYRMRTFKINLDAIKAHNSKPNRAYDLGESQFTDTTENEFESKLSFY